MKTTTHQKRSIALAELAESEGIGPEHVQKHSDLVDQLGWSDKDFTPELITSANRHMRQSLKREVERFHASKWFGVHVERVVCWMVCEFWDPKDILKALKKSNKTIKRDRFKKIIKNRTLAETSCPDFSSEIETMLDDLLD